MLFFLILTVLVGCGTTRKTSHEVTSDSTSVVVQIDSVIIKELVHDTTIIIQADTASMVARIECDSLNNVYLKEIIEYEAGSNVRPRVIIRDNKIYIECIVDSNAVYLHWKERYERVVKIDSTAIATSHEEVTTSKVVKRRGLWWLLMLIPIAVVVYVVRKFKIF